MNAWGASFGQAWGVSWGSAPSGAEVAAVVPDTIGSKPRKKIRGPYSDPNIYEAYIERCIAERDKPRTDVAAAILKEALVDAVDARRQAEHAELGALAKENALLGQLIATEEVKRNVQAIRARQRQIDALIERMEEEEAKDIITLLDEM